MILTFLGNEKLMSNAEIHDLLESDKLNPTSSAILVAELKQRNKW